jgi:putative membrane protein
MASQLRRRKIEALHLCLSFVFATKHYLRGEDGVYWADYHGVLPASFTQFVEASNSSHKMYAAIGNVSTSTSLDASVNSSGPHSSDATKRIRVKRSKQQISDQSTPLLAENVEIHHQTSEGSLPLPLIIAHELHRFIFHFRRDGFLETVGPAGLNGLNLLISGLVDQFTAMERIANTPIPMSYGVHLKQCVTLYLFALPMTLVNDFGWGTVPVVTAIAFTFMGIEGIADEIEMPFGNDDCDLPLDQYCQDLKEEIFFMIDRLPEGGEGLYGYDDGEGDD